ncbi:cytochrome P450 [Bisporella sp. PMI_857]|nr:cytochrome P450 [Bisporella sp. PMI_857]
MQYPDTPYIIDVTELQYVVYPPALFDEIKRLEEKEASVQDFFRSISYGHLGIETDALCKTIAVDLARSIPFKIPSQQKDARIAFDKYVGYCPNDKPFALFDTMLKISGSINASSFVGREIGTSEWPELVQSLLTSVYFAIKILNWIPSLIKPIIRPVLFLPTFKVQRDLRHMLISAIRRDMEEYDRAANRKDVLKPTEDGKLPFTQWLTSRYQPSQATQYQLTTDLLLVNIESTLKSAIALYSIVLELARRPQLQDELRREVEEVSMLDGQLPSTHLKELRKMDSMMRETSRVNPFSLFTLCRKTRRPLQLSLGPLLPAGTIICVDSQRINKSTTMFAEPQKFDPTRFLIRVDRSSDPNWGDGTQACPGRFFANSILKVCLTHLLMNYNLRLGDGQQQLNMVCMPNGVLAPDMGARVFFQSRN